MPIFTMARKSLSPKNNHDFENGTIVVLCSSYCGLRLVFTKVSLENAKSAKAKVEVSWLFLHCSDCNMTSAGKIITLRKF